MYCSEGNLWMSGVGGSGARTKISGSGLGTDYLPHVSVADRVVFVTYDLLTDKSLIWTCGIDGSMLTQYREGRHPRWSPDGKQIVFEYKEDIWLMSADGTALTQLTSTKDIGEYKPCFSPDGERIAFTSDEKKDGKGGGDFNIWYVDRSGRSKTKVTELKSWDSHPIWTDAGIFFLSGRAKGKNPVQRVWKIARADG